MELKKPADAWEMIPGAPNPKAAEALASAIRIDVAVEPEPEAIEAPRQPATTRITRSQTPLPARRQYCPRRQFSI